MADAAEPEEKPAREDRGHGGARKVCLVHSDKLLETSEKNPRFAGRGKLVHSLVEAYGLLQRLRVVEPEVVDRQELQAFHSTAYLAFLHSHNELQGEEEVEEEIETEAYGLGYDCPLFPGLFEYVCTVAGSSLAAADSLVREEADVAINWYGGWHHASKDEASGFCYCNDLVLAILRLLEKFKRVLYIDIDLHHGDGVENAFFHSSRVMTVSLHKFSPGFFPGTGDVDSVGAGRGKFHCVNVPLKDGMRDEQYGEIFTRVLSEVKGRFNPDVVVLQCGADMLSGDPVGSFSLTLRGVGRCVTFVLQWGIPTMLLGGGGYHFPNTARLWAYLTSLAVQHTLTNEIPEHENFECYGPDFTLHFTAGNRPNENLHKAVEELLQTISGYLSNVQTQ